jgi:hypothetical protein
LAGATAADFKVVGAGTVAAVSADLRRVSVDTAALVAGTPFQISYPVRPPRSRDAVAEVSLALDKALLSPAASPRAFVIPFTAAAARWAYYVVMDFAGDISTLRVVDATPGNGPRAVSFGDAGRVDLAQAPDPNDAVGTDLLRRNPGRRVVRLLSDAAVPAREAPLRQLELRLGDTRLLSPLANPRPDRFVSLKIAPAPAAIVLYDVLMLLAN